VQVEQDSEGREVDCVAPSMRRHRVEQVFETHGADKLQRQLDNSHKTQHALPLTRSITTQSTTREKKFLSLNRVSSGSERLCHMYTQSHGCNLLLPSCTSKPPEAISHPSLRHPFNQATDKSTLSLKRKSTHFPENYCVSEAILNRNFFTRNLQEQST